MQKRPDDALQREIDALQAPLAGRRWLAWLSMLLVLLCCLLLPVAASIWPAAFERIAQPQSAWRATPPIAPALQQTYTRASPTAMGLDAQWSPGSLAASHQPFGLDCKSCHAEPFKQVQDKDCLACHRDIGAHVADKVASMPALHETRCASCHRDHQGAEGLVSQNRRYIGEGCASCHGSLSQKLARSAVANVTDFAKDHPAFRVQLAQPDRSLLRQRQDSGVLQQPSNLKFPHDKHLRRDGIAGPQGKTRLDCASCHHPTQNRAGFEPISMPRDCQSCHALAFEPALSRRQVPHGAPAEVLSTLREFYGYAGSAQLPLDSQPAGGPVFTVRPGMPATPPASFVHGPGDARSRAAAAATELFEKTACISCHVVRRSTAAGQAGTPGADLPQWQIAPLPVRHSWMPKSSFDHRSHRQSACGDCHQAATSRAASDVLMPTIKECRSCHAGSTAVVGKVRSDCAMCHDYHLPNQHPQPAERAVQP